MKTLDCTYIGICGGCPWGERPLDTHLADKLKAVTGVYPEATMVYTPLNRVRDRVDLVWENVGGEMRLGLYGLESREVVDLHACPMMSEPLEKWFQEFRAKAPSVRKGSVRLRVSPSGEKGVWLDFANQDVKTLFDERAYLEWLSALAFVEIGQRRKALTWKDGQPKLVDPILKPWFETYDADFKPIPLYGPVGGFTQAGFSANRALVGAVAELVKASGSREWLELFSGNGNFALALAARGHAVQAVELDELALEGLRLSMEAGHLTVDILRADVYLKTKTLPGLGGRGLLVDPPRAGLRELLTVLEAGEKPSSLVYVSCFTEVFLSDAAKLTALGYTLKKLVGVDQFPFSPHNEWVGLFQL
jgi:23S rRNA (uracil1939-C5)-methyltransferase